MSRVVDLEEIGIPYDVVVIDPPWNQGKTGKRKCRPNQGVSLDYKTMSKEELIELPISSITSENAFIFLWTTNSKDKKTGEPFIKMSFDLLEAWGFEFYTMITWNKSTGPCPFGPFQITTEHLLFGYKGKANFEKDSLGKMKTCFEAKKGIHSEKPEFFYNNIGKYFTGRKIDLFARQERNGFDGWGNEYGKLD